jgi:hypothetical protein
MNNSSLANSLSVSVRIYRALLVAYPKTFREHYETQMVQVFRDTYREAYLQMGKLCVLDLWLHTIVDLVFTALIERIMEGSQYMFSPRIIVWGSIASAFGGLLWLLVAAAYQNEAILPMALLLTLGGLLALYIRHGKQVGSLGWIGFSLGILGTGMVMSLFVWGVITKNPFSIESPFIAALQYVLGISLFGIGCILIGLRTLRTEILPYGRWVPLALGILQIGFSISLWLVYYFAAIKGIDPWNPTTILAITFMLLTLPIGILWMALGVTLAINPNWQISNQPPASA